MEYPMSKRKRLKEFKVLNRMLSNCDDIMNIFFKDIRKQEIVSENEENELIRLVKEKNDKKAFDRLIGSNMRFVITVAKQYQGKGLDLCDLIQEGSLGLIHSINKFDPKKGCKFVTYAVYWIRVYIIKALQYQSRTIRLPHNQLTKYTKIKNETERFEQDNNRSPSILELEENTGIEHDRIYSIMASSINTISYDKPLRELNDLAPIDLIENDNAEPVVEKLEQKDISEKINNVLNKLSSRDQDIIRMYFGIGRLSMTPSEIARRLGIGPERVRQLLKKAISKIRRRYSKNLKGLL